jgi:hypothetical protein
MIQDMLILEEDPRLTGPIDDGFESPPHDFDDGDDDDEDPIRWETVATFWKSTDAHIARLKLESEEIDCMIIDENLVATDWLWANAVGGIKLQVPSPDAWKARQLLHRDASEQPRSFDEPVYDGLQRCPQCGSDAITEQRFSRRLAFWTILLLGAPLPFLHPGHRCSACGFEWKPS